MHKFLDWLDSHDLTLVAAHVAALGFVSMVMAVAFVGFLG